MNYEEESFAHQQHSLYLEQRHATRPITSLAPPADPLRVRETMQKVQAHDDQSSASGSGVADLHSLDNETDTFGRQIMQYERDARRLRSATHGDQQPVLKNRSRPRISELVARRERKEGLSAGQQHVRTASSGSGDSNPPLNVPRDWGTRARSQRGWMRKIREPSEADANSVKDNAINGFSGTDEEAVASRRTFGARDDFWSREDRLPAVDQTPPSMRRTRPAVDTGLPGESHSTLRQIIDSEDQDFCELSLLASTPAAVKPARGHRRSNDSENDLHGSHHTHEIRRNLLSERSPNRDGKQARARQTLADFDPTVPLHTALSYEERREIRRSGLVGNKENEILNDGDHDYNKHRRTATIPDRTARAVTFRQHQRPSTARNESRELLQRLATRLSPSPGKSSSETAPLETHDIQPQAHTETRRNPAPTDNFDSNPPVVRTARREIDRMRHEESQRNVRPKRSGSEEAQSKRVQAENAPAFEEQTLDEKGNVITGSGGETHEQPSDRRGLLRSSDAALIRAFGKSSGESNSKSENAPSGSSEKEKTNASGNTQRARSALEDIVREARKDPSGPFGDATLQSLEDIAHPNVDPTDTDLTFDTPNAYAENADEDLDIGRPLTQAEKDRRQEDLAIEAMNKHLRAARTSIKDAGRGLRRVENKWDSSSTTDAPQPASKVPDTKKESKEEPKPKPSQQTVCVHCGGHQSVWKGLWTEFRSNFYAYDRNARFGVRLTWLGFLTVMWMLWTVVENLLCWQYCHPLYAETMVGYGVDFDAPRYPFVIPTLLFRPFRPIWKPVVEWLYASFMAIFHMVFGEPPPERVPRYMQPGFEMTEDMINWDALMPRKKSSQTWDSTWTSEAASTVAAVAGKVTRSFVDAVDDIGYMNEDEHL